MLTSCKSVIWYSLSKQPTEDINDRYVDRQTNRQGKIYIEELAHDSVEFEQDSTADRSAE